MSKNESNSGALIVTVIVIGVSYVSFCMFTQAPADSPSQMPPMPEMSQPARDYLSPAKDPYVAALLAPDAASADAIQETDRFSLLVKQKLAEIDSKNHHLDPSKLRSDLLDNDPLFDKARRAGAYNSEKLLEGRSSAPSSAPPPASLMGGAAPPPSSLMSPAAPPSRAGVRPPATVSMAEKHTTDLLAKIDAAYQQGDTDMGMQKVKEALGYVSVHADVSARSRINLLLGAARLTHKMHDFDQSRSYISQAMVLSHQNHDYRIGDLEGVRCLLDGNIRDAAQFNMLLSKFNEKLSQSDFKNLPGLADELVAAAKSLPDDSFFRLHANLSKATAMLMAGKNNKDTEAAINKAEAVARKYQDMTIVASCEDLMVRLKSE